MNRTSTIQPGPGITLHLIQTLVASQSSCFTAFLVMASFSFLYYKLVLCDGEEGTCTHGLCWSPAQTWAVRVGSTLARFLLLFSFTRISLDTAKSTSWREAPDRRSSACVVCGYIFGSALLSLLRGLFGGRQKGTVGLFAFSNCEHNQSNKWEMNVK
jgi:hypothetical protein